MPYLADAASLIGGDSVRRMNHEPVVLATGERSQTAGEGGFYVYGGLLVDKHQLAGFVAATNLDTVADDAIVAAAAAHGARLVVNLILVAIAAPNVREPDAGADALVGRARTIAAQWRRPLLTETAAAMGLTPAMTRLIVMLARGIGALELRQQDSTFSAVLGLLPVAVSTGRRHSAALTTRPPKIRITEYRNRCHRLVKAIDAVR